MKPLTTTLATAGVAAAMSGAVLLAAGSSGAQATTSVTASKTVRVTTLRAPSDTLGINSKILNNRVNARRTYFGNSFGIGLGRDSQGAVYPVRTGNGGHTWQTDGPALYLPSADAPLAVNTVTAATRNLQYAYGGGGSVVDVTRGGGPTWRSALFDGEVMAVAPGPESNELLAYVDEGSGRNGVTYQYVTRNGGLSWSYNATVGGPTTTSGTGTTGTGTTGTGTTSTTQTIVGVPTPPAKSAG